MKYTFLTLLLVVTGCSSLPEDSSLSPTSTPEAVVCPVPALEKADANQAALPAPRFKESRFSALPGWQHGVTPEAWQALLRQCSRLIEQPQWTRACQNALDLGESVTPSQRRRFFEQHFKVWRVENGDGSNVGLITGYYEPILDGRLNRDNDYTYPIYGEPKDLLTIDLGDVLPELKGKRLRGRLQGQKVVPYLSRADIELEDQPMNAPVLAWVRDPVDLFFMQIQGSGQIMLPDGKHLHLGYADQNGYPYRSIGRYLIDQGELSLSHASVNGIKHWLDEHPDQLHHLLNQNPSYVFFRVLPDNLKDPIGALGIPLTPEASIAIDPRVIPLGSPVFLDTSEPNSNTPLRKLMFAQDMGGAIRGAVRADFYWGTGNHAGQRAGVMRQAGRMWLLYPKEYHPNPPH